MDIGKIVKGAVIDAAGWAGNFIGGPVGEKAGKKFATELLTKEAGDDSGYQPISTAVTPARFARITSNPRVLASGKVSGYAKAVNAQTLNAFWENRFDKYYTQAYKIKRIERT